MGLAMDELNLSNLRERHLDPTRVARDKPDLWKEDNPALAPFGFSYGRIGDSNSDAFLLFPLPLPVRFALSDTSLFRNFF